MNLIGDIPLTDHLFVNAIFPLGVTNSEAGVGNPTLGVSYVGRVMKKLWLTGGGNMGIPLIDNLTFFAGALPRALWNAHLNYPDIVPLTIELGLEYHVSIVELRAELNPSIWFPLAGEDFSGAFYHAAEIQLGHGIGGGLRLQGVVFGPTQDNYQAALSPFFVVSRDIGYLRTGIFIPISEPLGPPFSETWGYNLALGIHVD